MKHRHAFAVAIICLSISGCGGGQTTAPTPTPTQAQTTYTLSGSVRDAGNQNLLEGATVQVSGTGSSVSATTAFPGTYSVTGLRGAVTVTVSAAGYATTSKPLDISANATADFAVQRVVGKAVPCGDAPDTGNRVIPFLSRPFAGEYPLGNYFDHDVPEEFVDTNGRFVNACGDLITGQVDGHSGYDWLMPTGTPLLATNDGTAVIFDSPTSFCPPLNRDTTNRWIEIRTDAGALPIVVFVEYAHASRIDVVSGQRVTRGQVLGLSGNQGCSTAPHLHFQIRAGVAGNPQTDPYGWSGVDPDPWTLLPRGTSSVWLWRPGEAPRLRR